MSEGEEQQQDGVVKILLDEGIVEAEQVRYAQRIRKKLRDTRPLLELLRELGHVDEAQVRAALSARPRELRLGELLVGLGTLSESELEQALQLQQQDPDGKKQLGEVLTEHGFVDERKLYDVLALQLGYPFVSPVQSELDAALLEGIPRRWCRENRFLPLRRDGERVVVAFTSPPDDERLGAAERIFGAGSVTPALTTPAVLEELWTAIDGPGAGASKAKAAAASDEQAVVRTVDEVLEAALEAEASDVHVEPVKDRLLIRFREDGVLVPRRDLPLDMANAFTSRLKVLCKADIAERRRHQGGRLFFSSRGRQIDVRASFYVTVSGEKIVLRLLNRERPLLSLSEIGMFPVMLERFCEDALERPSGVILVTGPTGSGKTSTLYSCVHHINDPEIAIITAEDPVEYTIDGIAQCSLKPEIDLTFEESLRHIVRQDPDVIVIGEIRDQFSAETAIQAALTGHKVLTTFHTEDTIGGLLRLLNMNIEAFLISSTVISVLAQRLVRRVCDECAEPYEPSATDLRRLGYRGNDMDGAEMRVGRGCERCRQTGYRGRVAIFELLVLEEAIRDAIIAHSTSHEIRRISRENSSLVSLFEDGIVKAAKGLTTVREITRVLPRLDRPRPLPELRRLVGD